MNFFFYDDIGQIHEAGYCPDSMIDLQHRPGLHRGIGEVGINTHYVVNGEPVAMPLKPNAFAEFNYQTCQWEINMELAAQSVRRERDRLMLTTDWSQLPDVSEEKRKQWETYRQALRDVPEQEGFPLDVVWPERPV